MTLLLASAARATVGGRSGQEDAFRLWPAEGIVPTKADGAGLLAVLADGMGGHTGGAIAGQTACKTFAEVFAAASTPPEERLKSALQASNEALAKGVEQNSALRGMGCTLIGAWIDDLGIRWTSVGDSLLLLYRMPDVIRLNADHSLGSFLDEQARQNRISRSEAKRNRNRNALRSALTGSKIDLIDLRGEPLELRAGDWVLLASDGICTLDGDEIADVVYRYRQSTPDEMADGLIAAVTQKGAVDQDNTTVVAVRIEDAKSATDDVPTRIVMRPASGEDADLRTRRIGVSRPLRKDSKSWKAAVWLATAAALLISAAAVMVVLPSLRPTLSTSPDAATAPGVQTAAPATPAKAAVDPAPLPKPAAKPSAKTPSEAAAQPTAPVPPASKSTSEDGPAPRASPSKSSSAPQPEPPAAAPSPAKPTEGEDGTASRPAGPPKSAAIPQPAVPAAPSAEPGKEAVSEPASPGGWTAKPTVEGGEDGAARSGAGKTPGSPPLVKPRPNLARPAAPPPAKWAASGEERKRAKSIPELGGFVTEEPKEDFKVKSDALTTPQQ
jgi:serine/threonine protein phosphatase PrpC